MNQLTGFYMSEQLVIKGIKPVYLLVYFLLVVSETRRRRDRFVFDPRSEKFTIVSNDHGHTEKCDLCVSVCKTNFRDHQTPYTIQGFTDSLLVCKIHDCKNMQKSVKYAKISSIFAPSLQAMQAIAMVRLSK